MFESYQDSLSCFQSNNTINWICHNHSQAQFSRLPSVKLSRHSSKSCRCLHFRKYILKFRSAFWIDFSPIPTPLICHSSFLNCTLLTDKHQPRLSLSCQSFEVLAGDGCSRSKLIANTSPSNASYNNFPKRKIFGKILSCTEFAKKNDTLIQCNTVSIFPKNTYSWICYNSDHSEWRQYVVSMPSSSWNTIKIVRHRTLNLLLRNISALYIWVHCPWTFLIGFFWCSIIDNMLRHNNFLPEGTLPPTFIFYIADPNA